MEAKTDGTPRFFRGRQFKILSMDNFDKLSRARARLFRESDDNFNNELYLDRVNSSVQSCPRGREGKGETTSSRSKKEREREITAPKRRTQVQSLQVRSFNQRSTTPSLKNEQNIS